jgi:hypothetical protein
MSKQLTVREVPQPTTVVGHGIAPPMYVVMQRHTSEVTLIQGLYAEKLRSWDRR